MSLVISLYSRNAFYEYLLPAVNNTDYNITVRREIFGLGRDLHLALEVVDNIWRLKSSRYYSIFEGEKFCCACELSDTKVIKLRIREGSELVVMINQEDRVFHSFGKYFLSGDKDISIGRDPECDICCDYINLVSRNHARIYMRDDGTYIENFSRNGLYVNGDRVDDELRLEFGDHINIIGLHIVYLGNQLAIDGDRRSVKINENILIPDTGDQNFTEVSLFSGDRIHPWTVYNRAPRIREAIPTEPIIIDAPPHIAGIRRITAFSNNQKKYREYLDLKRKEISSRTEEVLRIMNDMYPDPASILTSDYSGGRMWSRESLHGDFLRHRIGTGAIPSPFEIRIPADRFPIESDTATDSPSSIKRENEYIYGAPVTVDLFEHRLIGIIGGENRKAAAEAARSLSLQIAYANCYTDVRMCFIYDGESTADRGEWDYARWLPHVWSPDRSTRYIAADKAESIEVLGEISEIIRDRVGSTMNTGRGDKMPLPHYIVFISDMSVLEGNPFAKFASDCDPAYGLTVILIAESYNQLPSRCEYIIEHTAEYSGCYSVYGGRQRQDTEFDFVAAADMEKFARQLSALRVSDEKNEAGLPSSVGFLEMLGAHKPEDLQSREKWIKNRTYDSIRGQIGMLSNGMPCILDAHERYHGPHGIVAGMTGSGKSEMLLTYILSLSINYSPEDVSFFIIDYKGGGMANQLRGLPHLIGDISNLSGSRVRRALISIKSEIQRRQTILGRYAVNNIDSYTRLCKNNRAELPIPHLFIVIDEFAELRKEEPEFMKELISVSRLGRSLGIHLILSTQRPGGVVDNSILSNSRFRICLKVQDKNDSSELLNRPDAAYITQTGRGYLMVGNDEVFEQFQSGYSGKTYNGESGADDIVQMITSSGHPVLTGRKYGIYEDKPDEESQTELHAVIGYLRDTASSLELRQMRSLWMPELGSCINLEDIEEFRDCRFSEERGWPSSRKNADISIVIGRWDDPASQSQPPFVIDMAGTGNTAVCGSVVSGKSTFLQTMAYSLISMYTPDAVNLYLIDYSSNMLRYFEKAPHVGGVMTAEQPDRIDKFFVMMQSVITERRSVLRGGSYKQYISSHDTPLPLIVIMIDNYASFREDTDEKYDDIIAQLSREGPGNGICLVITGSGYGHNAIPMRIAESVNNALALSLRDRYEYSEILHVMKIDTLPEPGIRGRGIALKDGRPLEFQTALAVTGDNDYERSEKISLMCSSMRNAWTGKRAMRIPEIPDKPDWLTFTSEDEYLPMIRSRKYLPAGYRSDQASLYGIPLGETYCYGIYGHRISGKTNMLRVCILSARDMDAAICIIDDRDGDLSSMKDLRNTVYCSSNEEIFRWFEDLVPEVRARGARRKELENEGLSAEELFSRMSGEFRPVFIFIADLAGTIRSIYDSEQNMNGFLENLLSRGKSLNIYFIFELSLDRRTESAGLRAFDLITGYRKGIHMGGYAMENPFLNFNHLPYTERSAAQRCGTGILPADESNTGVCRVIVPIVENQDIQDINIELKDNRKNGKTADI